MEYGLPASIRADMQRWQWLLLLSPAVEIGLVSFMAYPLGNFFFPSDEHLRGLAVMIYNLFVAAALCFGVGLWLVGSTGHWAVRLANGLLYGILLAILNGGIAFAGCALLAR